MQEPGQQVPHLSEDQSPNIQLSDLKIKFKTAREILDQKFFPEDLISQFAEYIDWVIEKTPAETVCQDPDLKKFFFEEFVGGIAKRLSQIKELPDNYFPLVSRLVLSLGDLYKQTIDNSDLADAMRYLFESLCPLHQNLFQSEESNLLKASYDPEAGHRMSDEQRQWRKSLKPGDKVDCVKRAGDFNLKMWAKATILNVDGDLIHVKFDNDSYTACASFWWYSEEIEKYNTKSEDDDWRSNLKSDDQVDTLDSTRIWYQSTVVYSYVKEEQGNEYPVVKIGFRVYTPDGDKVDNDQRRFIGWSEGMDEILPAHSPRIQKFGTFAKSFDESRAQLGQKLEETLEDQMDQMIYAKNPNNIVYAVPRAKHKSGLLVTLLNRLGREGFFDQMLNKIQQNDENISLETVFYYVDQISKSSPLFNRLFVDKFYPSLLEAVKQKFLSASEASLRNFRRDRLESLLTTIFSGFMVRIMAYQPRNQEQNIFMLDLGIQFLRLNFLEKRIDGAKMISEVCKNANQMSQSASIENLRSSVEKTQTAAFINKLIQKIREGGVLNQMFSKERGHQQMVERAEELLKLLIAEDALSEEDLALIWTATKLDETTMLEVYKLFNELSSRLKSAQIIFIVRHLSQVPLHKTLQDQVSLVHELGKRARTEHSDYAEIIVEYLLRVAIPAQEGAGDKVVVNLAGMAFTDVIKNWSNKAKVIYIKRITESLKANQEGYLCIKMLARIFRDFQGEIIENKQQSQDTMEIDESSQPIEINHFENRSTFIEYVDEQFDLMYIFFLNFQHYILKARQNLRQKQFEGQTDLNTFSEKVLAERFIHSDQMTERFDFLKFIAQNSTVKVNKHHLSLLWRELVYHQMFKSDSDQFYRFLKEVCDLQNRGYFVVRFQELIEFFQETVFSSQAGDQVYEMMTAEGFSCIFSFFIMINQSEKKIQRLLPQNPDSSINTSVGQYPPAPKMTSFSNTSGGSYQNFSFSNKMNNQPTDSEDHGFHVLVAPWELLGIDGIWKLAVNSVNFEVQDKATSLLIRCFTTPTFELENRITEFEGYFIRYCLQKIKEYKDIIINREYQPAEQYEKVEKPLSKLSSITTTITQRIQPPEEKKILKYLKLIKEIIKNSEKEGNRGVKSHNGLFKGNYLDCLQLTNSLKAGTKYQQKLELGVNSNITLFELRKLIGEHVARVYTGEKAFIQETPCHPYSVRIYRYSGCSDIPEIDNGKTLAELKFKRNEQLTIYRRSVTNSSRLFLTNLDGTDLNPRLLFILNEAFDRFSELQEHPIHGNARKVMTKAHLRSLISILTDDDTKEEDPQLNQIFFNYNKDGVIEREDYLMFWRNSIFNDENLVWQNLFNIGYRYDLKPIAQDGMDHELYQLRKSIQEMPRYILSANQEFFNGIFSLIETMNSEISEAAWSIIKNLSTNPILYRKVLALDREPGFQWNDIFDTESLHKMLYALQIVEALIEECSHLSEENSPFETIITEEYSLKLDWVQRFMSLGGFQQILQMFHKSLEIISGKDIDKITKFEKNFLEQMLKLIKIFVLAAYSVDDHDNTVLEVLSLVKSKSSNKSQNEGQKDADGKPIDANYQTPSKKTRSKFVQKMQDKRVQFQDEQLAASQITEDFLFGDLGVAPQDQNQQTEQYQESIELNQQLIEANQQQASDDTDKRFAALSKIMKHSGQSSDILAKIDFVDLQAQMLEVICLILQKKEVSLDESLIVENALGLWVATLIKNNELINKFYEFNRPWATYYFAIKNVQDLLGNGLFTYKSAKIREDFGAAILCIAQKVKNQTGIKPIVFLINMMRNNYPREDLYYVWRECKQFFDLFISLIEEYFRQNQDGSLQDFDIYEILKEAISKLMGHECKEKKGSLLEDKTLMGYFSMVERLINMIIIKYGQDRARVAEIVSSSQIVDKLFQDYLFFNPQTQQENKLQTKESRSQCFALLQKLIESLLPHQLNEFLEERLWGMIKDMQRPKAWKFVPQDNSKSAMQSNYVGLVNLGCICYMNSMLQQFFMVPQFRYQLLKAIDETPRDLKEYKGYYVDDNLLRQLQIMFANLELSERQAFYPLGFCFAFKDFEGNPTNTAIQQDAQEFLNIFFARLEELLKPTTQKHLLDSIFGGKVVSQLKCPSCGSIRNLLESFYTLTVTVKDRKGLIDSLQKMIETSIINDFRCENCKQKVDVEKRQLIGETPNVLIVHLQRIIFNFDTFQNDKINTYFDFPNTLDLKEFSYKSVMSSEGHSDEVLANETTKHLLDITDDEYIYKLVGVTIHRGTAEHGHYYSLINTRRGKDELDESRPEWLQTDRDNWRVFDDENIKAFSFSDLRTEAFGGSSSSGPSYQDSEMSAYYMQSGAGNSYGQNAYMLVYEKMNKKPLKEVILPSKQDLQQPVQSAEKVTESSENVSMDVDQSNSRRVETSLDCIDTAVSRASVETSSISAPMPNQEDNASEGGQKGSNEEKYNVISYKQIDPFVPDWIKSQVLQDNTIFMIDRHIYSEQFFGFVKNTLKHIANNIMMTQHLYSHQYIPEFTKLKKTAFKIAGKAMFDMLAYYFYNVQMAEITSTMQTILTFSDSVFTFERGDPSVIMEFVKEYYLGDGCQNFFNIMFQCTDKTSRMYIGKLTSVVVNKIYNLYEDAVYKGIQIPEQLEELKEMADAMVTKFIQNLKTPDCIKNWQKIEHYLQMIQDIAIGGQLQQHLLLTRFDIVAYLLEFLMANCNMKTSTKLANFSQVVYLICFFTRFSLTPPMRLEYLTWVADDELGPQKPGTLLGWDVTKLKGLPEEQYPLKDETLDMILASDFVEMSLKEGVETLQLGKMIAHMSYKFEKFSKRIAKMLLSGISRNDYEKVRNYLDVVTELVMVRDQFQRARLEWLFGFGSLVSHTQNVKITNDPNEMMIKVGVKVLHSLSDECFCFKSSLIQDSTDDALLHLLWRYKGRIDSYAVNCIFSLLNLMAYDENVAQYFASLPGPTYCLSRYTDWIEPYLQKQLAEARKGYSGSYSSQKEDIVVKCLSLYEKYDGFLKSRQLKPPSQQISQAPVANFKVHEEEKEPLLHDVVEFEEENVRNLISSASLQRGDSDGVVAKYENHQPAVNVSSFEPSPKQEVLRCSPQPYVIVDCLSERNVYLNDYGNVILEISALGCSYTESIPTGESNLAFPEGIFKKRSATGQQSSSHEQNLQAACINNYFQSSSLGQKVNAGKQRLRRNGVMVAREQLEEERIENDDVDLYGPGTASKTLIKDDDDQWQMVNKEGVAEENVSFDSNHADSPEPVYRIRVIEEGEDSNTHMNSAQDQPAFITQSAAENPQGAQGSAAAAGDTQMEAEQVDVQWPNELNYCDDLVYRITVTNYREGPIKCKLRFKVDEDSYTSKDVNLFYPEGGFKATVQGKDTKTILLLHKIRPDIDSDVPEINKLITQFNFKMKFAQSASKAPAAVPYSENPSDPQNDGYTALRNRRAAQVHPMNDNPSALVNTRKNADVNLNDSNHASFNDEDDSEHEWQQQMFNPDDAVVVKSDKDNKPDLDKQDQGHDNGYQAMVDQEYLDQKQCPVCTFLNTLEAGICEMCYHQF